MGLHSDTLSQHEAKQTNQKKSKSLFSPSYILFLTLQSNPLPWRNPSNCAEGQDWFEHNVEV